MFTKNVSQFGWGKIKQRFTNSVHPFNTEHLTHGLIHFKDHPFVVDGNSFNSRFPQLAELGFTCLEGYFCLLAFGEVKNRGDLHYLSIPGHCARMRFYRYRRTVFSQKRVFILLFDIFAHASEHQRYGIGGNEISHRSSDHFCQFVSEHRCKP